MEKKSDPQHSSAESLDLKKIHTCLYGEKKGKILVSTWLYRFKKSQVGADETVKTPSASRLSMLQSAITAASKNDFNKAWALANAAGYTVCKMELEKDRNVVIAWQVSGEKSAVIEPTVFCCCSLGLRGTFCSSRGMDSIRI